MPLKVGGSDAPLQQRRITIQLFFLIPVDSSSELFQNIIPTLTPCFQLCHIPPHLPSLPFQRATHFLRLFPSTLQLSLQFPRQPQLGLAFSFRRLDDLMCAQQRNRIAMLKALGSLTIGGLMAATGAMTANPLLTGAGVTIVAGCSFFHRLLNKCGGFLPVGLATNS